MFCTERVQISRKKFVCIYAVLKYGEKEELSLATLINVATLPLMLSLNERSNTRTNCFDQQRERKRERGGTSGITEHIVCESVYVSAPGRLPQAFIRALLKRHRNHIRKGYFILYAMVRGVGRPCSQAKHLPFAPPNKVQRETNPRNTGMKGCYRAKNHQPVNP